MVCHVVKFGNGTAIVCSRRQRRRRCPFCHKRDATKLCDHPTGSGTCDAPMCENCATVVGLDRDLCPDHATQGELAL